MVPRDPFTEFEFDGWQRAAADYAEGFAALTAQALPALLDAAGVREGTRLLDVACGTGELAALAMLRGAQVDAADLAPAMLERTRVRVPRARTHEADAQALPFGDATFDAVTLAFLLGHVADPARVLSEARRVTRGGGRVAVAWWRGFEAARGFGVVYDALRAHGDLASPLPAGPPFDQFGDGGRLHDAIVQAGFSDVRVEERPLVWRLPDADTLLGHFLAGSVRTGALLRAQSAAKLDEIRDVVRAACAQYAGPAGLALPMPVWVASAEVPA